MASNITKAPVLRAISIRRYASCPQTIPISGIPEYEIKTTVLPNKIVVASAENESVISRVSVLFRAGSRNETAENLGVTHVLRASAGLSTCKSSQFAIARNLQEVGSSLTCAADREVVAYTLEGTRPALETSLPFLTEVATQQVFRPWEVSDQTRRIQLELATRSPQFRAVDLLHQAAYRSGGLGNSLHIAKHQLGKISRETLQHYFNSNFGSKRCAVVGLGVDHKDLVNYAQCLKMDTGCPDPPKCEYKGGEIRCDKGGKFVHIAIAGKGGSLRNAKDALSFAVLQRALGTGTSIKYNSENKGLFAKVVGCNKGPGSVTALNVSYSDSGLFGALISVSAGNAANAVNDVVSILRSGKISEDDVCRAKNQLKRAVLTGLEQGGVAVEDMGNQAVLIGSVANACQIASAIDGLSLSDINCALAKVAGCPLSMASVGNLRCVPYVDEV